MEKLDIEKFDLFPIEKTISGDTIIPNKSGMYAWYLNFAKFQNISTKEEFEINIQKIDDLISKDTLNGSVKSFFRKYDIRLDETRIFVEKFITEEENGVSTVGEKLASLTIEQCKDILKHLAKFSILVSPLYVGIATSLRTRFRQHKKAFEAIKEMQNNNDDLLLVMSEGEKSFGGRAAIRGFNWDQLVFACVEMEIDRRSIQEQEFLINRFYNPILGRK
eukprot:GDKJ01021448.1.p2 GENE.GDKJ01021448.1~~GDKJ01021448.1.p2  ORF type:complete len:220 (-),score=18.00 GDKJ01021448.1:106-765(-)